LAFGLAFLVWSTPPFGICSPPCALANVIADLTQGNARRSTLKSSRKKRSNGWTRCAAWKKSSAACVSNMKH
jgi:hypothetical protein